MTSTLIAEDAIYTLVNQAGVLYAARQSGLFRSTDGGQKWQSCLESLPDTGALTVTALSIHEDTIFAGTKGSILCSYDAGEHWTIVGLASPPPEVVTIAISPNFATDGTAVAGTSDDGVFITADRGSSWTAWNFGLIDMHVFAVAFSPRYFNDRTLFAGTESGIFVSKNAGRGWMETNFPMEAAPVISLMVAPSSPSDSVLYAGTEAHGLWTSHNQGAAWLRIAEDQMTGDVNTILIKQHPLPEVSVLLENKIMRSTNYGVTWTSTSLDVSDSALPMTMSFHPNDPAALIVGYSDGFLLPVI